MQPARSQRRAIPAVDRLLQALGDTGLPRPLVVAAVRRHLASLRAGRSVPPADEIDSVIRRELADLRASALQPVINATGIVIHTNLGRAPLGPDAVALLSSLAAHYNNLEIDLATGERGTRAGYVESLLATICGTEAATVVNNGAAALVLALRHFTAGPRKEVVISRGELVQIGGGFRIPEVLESSGARLREVGTTNRTTTADYARAIGRDTALLLRVHRSNFFMDGFVESPPTAELAALARRKRVRLFEDLGSGAACATENLGLGHEPTPAESLRAGVDLVCFSGDKLFGGPQAGILAGRARLVGALKREPFFRALRCDKLVLGALQATAEGWLRQPERERQPKEATGPHPVRVMELLETGVGTLQARAERLRAGLAGAPAEVSIGTGRGEVGGGTLPRARVDSVTLEFKPRHVTAAELASRLRRGTPPVIGYLGGGRLKLDLRTVFPEQDPALFTAISQALADGRGG